jgi:hypothetical protein
MDVAITRPGSESDYENVSLRRPVHAGKRLRSRQDSGNSHDLQGCGAASRLRCLRRRRRTEIAEHPTEMGGERVRCDAMRCDVTQPDMMTR